MGELENLLKITNKEFPLFPKLGIEILRTFLTRTEREFRELLFNPEISQIILKVANLPQYKKNAPQIEDINKALLILGEDFVKILLLGFIAQKITKTTFNEFSFSKFWARALGNVCFSQLLSSFYKPPPHLYISSFLMDYGIIVLYLIAPEGYLKVLKLKTMDKSLLDAEKEVFNTDHAQIGGEYFEYYNFPRRFVLNIYYHHRVFDFPEELPKEIYEDVKLLHLIDLGVGAYFSINREKKYRDFKNFAKMEFGMSEKTAEELIEKLPSIANQFYEALNYEDFILTPYSEWIKNKEKEIQKKLKEIELQKKKEETVIERYADEISKLLREKNELLKKIEDLKDELEKNRILDELTGLYNSEFFTKRLQEEILRSKRYRRQFSILLIDIDRFEKIFENYGASEEESILRIIAEKLKNNLRKVDIIGKLKNSNQFIILLPETPLQGAWVVGRRILRLVERTFYEKYNQNFDIYIVILTFNPAKLDPKKETSTDNIYKILFTGMKLLKEKKQRKIFAILIDRELK